MASWLRLSRREETWQAAEILLLRHQLTALLQRQPRRLDLDWADRTLLATLLILGVTLRKRRYQELRRGQTSFSQDPARCPQSPSLG